MDEAKHGPEEMTVEEALLYAAEHHRAGSLEEAATVYERILDVEPDHPPTLSYLGLLRFQTGWPIEAEALLRKSVELAPEYADGHFNLANVLANLEKNEEALAAYRRVLEIDPAHLGTLTSLGDLLFRMDRFEEAVAEYEKAIGIDPRSDRALRNLARIYYRQRDIDSAMRIYREWLAIEPECGTARHLLAACGEGEIPERASDAYLIEEFDDFAESFEKTLAKLDYQGPTHCRNALAKAVPVPAGDLRTLDAGCGTGLLGVQLRPYARHLVGVDLSPRMLAYARAKGIYDELVESELTAYLEGCEGFDLIAAADTLIYFGRLEEVLGAVARVLAPEGLFVATVEAGEPEEEFRLLPHGRYRHGEPYLRNCLAEAGLSPEGFDRIFLRKELRSNVEGFVILARRTAVL